MLEFTAQQFKASVRSAANFERAILAADQQVDNLDMSEIDENLSPRI